MHEGSCSQFFNTTTGIQSGTLALEESRSIMTKIIFRVRRKDYLQKVKQEKRYLSHQDKKRFQQILLLYQMQKAAPHKH